MELGKGAVIRIGNGTYLNRNTFVLANSMVDIGSDVRISWDVIIMDSDQHEVPGSVKGDRPITIESDVLIGCRSIILKGVHIGKGAIIGAGSLVTRNVPAFTVVGGVPARVLYKFHAPDK
jgi:acetyltransferase-like isoleucine patch superfamily enzyme